jgi:hypothetical protein
MSAPNQGPAGANAGGNDYLDKAFNAVASKFGGAQGKKVANNKAMSEKIVRFSKKNSLSLPFSYLLSISLSLSLFLFSIIFYFLYSLPMLHTCHHYAFRLLYLARWGDIYVI